MSNTLAIGAVTATLRNLLDKAVAEEGGGLHATTLAPEKAQIFGQADGPGRVNLFLYQTQINAAWRNMDMPRQIKPNETGQPPLALDLYYLLTAYERDDGDASVMAHRLLGRAMRVLHDHPLLGAGEIRSALPNNDLADQIERIRIIPQTMSVEEFSKLWTTFQVGYRISAAYHVSVVLIDSTLPSRTPLPVLARGAKDTGAVAQPDLIPPFPTLTGVSPDVQPPGSETSAVLGNNLLLSGHDLDGTNVSAEVSHPLLSAAVSLPAPLSATATAITVNLPNQPQNFPAGIYAISVSVTRPSETFKRTSNALPFALAPQINPPINAARNANKITLTLSCGPEVLPQQRVALLLGGDEVPAEAHPAPTGNLTFVAKDDPPGKFAAGDYFVRLRVDGVDSLLIDRSVQPPKFDPSQKVTIP
jgi:Pvc16 N-terminal domain